MTLDSESVGHGFAKALIAEPELAVIAEVKRKSPSAGDLRPGLGAAETAIEYVRGGAACISVLTEGPRFGGSPEDLKSVKQAVDAPSAAQGLPHNSPTHPRRMLRWVPTQCC